MNFIEFALGVLVLCFAATLGVMVLGMAGCIESDAFKNQRTVVVVRDTAELQEVLK